MVRHFYDFMWNKQQAHTIGDCDVITMYDSLQLDVTLRVTKLVQK